MKRARFTFKKQPRNTGLAAVGCPDPNTDIKLNGAVVGKIIAPNWTTLDGKWRVTFHVDDGGDPKKWRWVTFKNRFDEEPQARAFVKNHALKIIALGLHPEEAD